MTRGETWDKAYKRIFELYGEDPDFRIVNRFLSEKAALAHFGVAEYFEELAGICQESIDKYNEKLVVKNHGSCGRYNICASIMQVIKLHENNLIEKIEKMVSDMNEKVKLEND